MSHLPNALNLIGRLLSYPEPGTVELAEHLCIELRDELSQAAPGADEFLAFARQSDIREIEEVYTRTFDINPACALEVGWHLFGEEYIRGLFLVRMREELRKYSLPETVELPDHVTHVLSVTAAMPADEAARFVPACVLPAVGKMNQALAEKETPYRHIISCLESVLTIRWGAALEVASEKSPTAGAPRTGSSDLLHAFPVPDVTGDCDSCCRVPTDAVPQDAIPRETEFPGIHGRDDYPKPNRSKKDISDPFNLNSQSLLATDREDSPTPTPARKR